MENNFGVEFICPYYERPDQQTLAKLLLYQSGQLGFFNIEQGDQIEIISMQVNVFGIKIVAKLGDEEKTFYLKTIRTTKDILQFNEKISGNKNCTSTSSSSSSSSSSDVEMKVKEKKPKRGFLDGYKTYDPSVEGYGNPAEWREAFFQRLGIDRANEVLGEDDPLTLLGITSIRPTWEEITQKFRRLILSCHPDRNPDNEEALIKSRKIIAAFEVLEERYGPE